MLCRILRPMIRIKASKAAPGFKSPSRHVNGRIFDICVRWRNAEGGLKDKQLGVFLIMGLMMDLERRERLPGCMNSGKMQTKPFICVWISQLVTKVKNTGGRSMEIPALGRTV